MRGLVALLVPGLLLLGVAWRGDGVYALRRSLPIGLVLMALHSTVDALWHAYAPYSAALTLMALYVIAIPRLLAAGNRGRVAPSAWPIVRWGALTLVLVGTGVFAGDRRVSQIAVAVTVLLCLVEVATSPVRRRLSPGRIAQALGIWVSILSLVSLLQGTTWRPCDALTGKCTPAHGLYAAGLPSENLLAIVASMGLILSLVDFRSLRLSRTWLARVTLPLGFCVALVFSGSRTSALAVAIGLLTGLGFVLIRRQKPLARLAVFAVPVGLAVVGVVVLFKATGGSLSNRGNLWSSALRATDVYSVVGKGEVGWLNAQALGIIPNHYPHSEYLLVIFFGGLAGLLVLLALNIDVLVRLYRAGCMDPALLGLTPFVMAVGLTEVIWDPTGVDAGLVILLSFVLAVNRVDDELGAGAPTTTSTPAARHSRAASVRADTANPNLSGSNATWSAS